jgi:hypothetical protein
MCREYKFAVMLAFEVFEFCGIFRGFFSYAYGMILSCILMIRHERVAFFVFISGPFSVLLLEGGDMFFVMVFMP